MRKVLSNDIEHSRSQFLLTLPDCLSRQQTPPRVDNSLKLARARQTSLADDNLLLLLKQLSVPKTNGTKSLNRQNKVFFSQHTQISQVEAQKQHSQKQLQQEDLEQYKQQLIKIQNTNKQLEEEIQIERQQKQHEVSLIKSTVEQLTIQLKSKNEQFEQLKVVASAKQKDQSQLKKHIQLLKQENSNLNLRIQQLQQQAENDRKEYAINIQNCQEKHKSDLEKFKQLIDKQNRNPEVSSEIQNLKLTNAQLTTSLRQLQRDCQVYKQRNQQLSTQMKEYESKQFTQKNKSVQCQIQDEENNQKDQELHNTLAQLHTSKSMQQDLQERLHKMEKQIGQQSVIDNLSNGQNKFFGFDRSIVDSPIKTETAPLPGEDHTILVHQLVSLQTSNEQLMSTVEELKQELEERELNENKLIQKIKSLSSQLQEKEGMLKRASSQSPSKGL